VIETCLQKKPELVQRVMELRLDAAGRDSPTHDMLARIPFRAVVTTNYDTFIERKRPGCRVLLPDDVESAEAVGILQILANPDPFPVFKIHGTSDRPETIRFRSEDYDVIPMGQSKYRDALVMMFATYPVFFYGHSLGDPRVQLLFEQASQAAGRIAPQHYALIWNTDVDAARAGLAPLNIEPIVAKPPIQSAAALAFLEQLLLNSN
jgi:hypothetical protein